MNGAEGDAAGDWAGLRCRCGQAAGLKAGDQADRANALAVEFLVEGREGVPSDAAVRVVVDELDPAAGLFGSTSSF